MFIHPLSPLRAEEIQLASELLTSSYPDTGLRFKIIDLNEPVKKDLIPFLEAERTGVELPSPPPRILYAFYHRTDNRSFFKAYVNVTEGKVMEIKEISGHIQGPVDISEVIELEKLCLEHPMVLAEIKKLKLPSGITVCTDPWIYGADNDIETRRLTQFYMYLVDNHPDSNHYSLPLAFSPIFDANTYQFVRMDYLPTGADEKITETQPWKPKKAIEFAEGLLSDPVRTDLKPYIVQQPEGASFNISDENVISWQKWRFRIRTTYREGMVLQNVTYDGRNVVYRMAINEMTVPYGDPRAPYHRKQAFDAGDVGFGATANSLKLGCDCLGEIHYFDGWIADTKGQAIPMKNIICLHEQDAGLGFKHTNYRTETVTVTRKRELVVQMVCTLANYEYVFAYMFDQAGAIECEVRATGILSTMPIDEGVTVPWGTNVGAGVMAPYHQHMFSLRIDPAIDGYNNTAFYEESVPLPRDDKLNKYGAGYIAKPTTIVKSGSLDLDTSANRTFKIRNDSVINEVSSKPVAYKIHPAPSQMLLYDPDTYHSKRARYASKVFWYTKHQEEELYAAGEFTNQSRKSNGVEVWAARNDDIENSDLVVWHTFGLTHNPRPEDFPVMPVEIVKVALKPDGFFTKNPALDVPQSTQKFNQSTLYHHLNGSSHNGINGTGGAHGTHGTHETGCCSSSQ